MLHKELMTFFHLHSLGASVSAPAASLLHFVTQLPLTSYFSFVPNSFNMGAMVRLLSPRRCLERIV